MCVFFSRSSRSSLFSSVHMKHNRLMNFRNLLLISVPGEQEKKSTRIENKQNPKLRLFKRNEKKKQQIMSK